MLPPRTGGPAEPRPTRAAHTWSRLQGTHASLQSRWAQVTPQSPQLKTASGNLGRNACPGLRCSPWGVHWAGRGRGGASGGRGGAWSAGAWGGGPAPAQEATLHAGHQICNGGDVSRGLPQRPLWDSGAMRSAGLAPRWSFWAGSRLLCCLCPTPCASLTPRSQARGR